MDDERFDAEERGLALYYALTALVKTLIDDELMERDHLFRNLAGATKLLQTSGEPGAAAALGEICKSWTAV